MILIPLYVGCGAPPPLTPEVAPHDPVDEVSGESLYQAGIRHAQAGDMLRAEQYLASSMRRGYDEAEALRALIRVCVSGSRLRAALQYAEPYLRNHPDDWTLRYLAATIHLGLDEPDIARSHLTRVIELAPEEPDAHFTMARLLRDHDADIAGAAESFQRYLSLSPEGARAAEATEALRRIHVPVVRTQSGLVMGGAEDPSDQTDPEVAP